MGLLSEGRPLNWEETKSLAEHVRKHGIEQFISLYARLRDRQGDILKWGDEVEYILVRFDDNKQTAQVSLTAIKLLQELNKKEEEDPQGEMHYSIPCVADDVIHVRPPPFRRKIPLAPRVRRLHD